MKNIEPKRFKASSVMHREKDSKKAEDDNKNEKIWAHQYALGIGHSSSRPYMEHSCIKEMIRDNRQQSISVL